MDLSLFRFISLLLAKSLIYFFQETKHCFGPGSEGKELGFFSPLLYFSAPLLHALRAPLALCSPLISSLDGSDGLRRYFPTKKGKGFLTSRCRFVFRPK
jgi:hypothetical protein